MVRLPQGQAHFVEAGDLTLHVRFDEGGAGPAFAYVNSLGSDLRIWDGVVARVRGRHLRHDLRGHGLSEAPQGPYTIRAMAADLRALLERAAWDSVVLVGISVGGLIALRFALEWPEAVRALVICDSGARIGSEEAWNERIALVQDRGLESVAGSVVPRWFSSGFADRERAILAGHRNMLGRTPAHGYAATCAALRDEDLRGRAPEIEVPTLVLCGSDDSSTPPEMNRELAEALPHGRYREIADAGHLPCLERPEAVAAAIEEFVAEVTTGG